MASQICHRHIDRSDDEASIALIALNEAIGRWRPSGGASFVSIVEAVVWSRLTDEYRRARRWSKNVPLSSLDLADESGEASANWADMKMAVDAFAAREAAEPARRAVEALEATLAEYGLSLHAFSDAAPQHRPTIAKTVAVARMVADNPQWLAWLREHRKLPTAKMARAGMKCDPQTVGRHRRFIVGMALALGAGVFDDPAPRPRMREAM